MSYDPQRCSLKYHLLEKANTIADFLVNLFTHHDLCDKHYEQWVEVRIQALLKSTDTNPPERVRPCDVQKLMVFKTGKGLWK
jgi:hypothetical protein